VRKHCFDSFPFFDEPPHLRFRMAEQPCAALVARNVDGGIAVVQAGVGQPAEAGPPGRWMTQAVRLRIVNPSPALVSAAKRGASTHPGILKRRQGNSYLWDASHGHSAGAARRRQ
jgi:hypothetical protein